MREHVERLAVTRARVAHRVREALDRLDVLREDLDSGIHDGLDVGKHALEVRRQRFDRGRGIRRLDRAHAGREMRGAAVRQVVAIHRGQHDVAEAHQRNRARGVRGLVGVEPAARIAGVHRAEAAGARAHRAHEEERRRAGIPALADVRAMRFFADRAEAVLAHGLPQHLVARSGRERGTQPARLLARRERQRARALLDAVANRRKTLGRDEFLATLRGTRLDLDGNAF